MLGSSQAFIPLFSFAWVFLLWVLQLLPICELVHIYAMYLRRLNDLRFIIKWFWASKMETFWVLKSKCHVAMRAAANEESLGLLLVLCWFCSYCLALPFFSGLVWHGKQIMTALIPRIWEGCGIWSSFIQETFVKWSVETASGLVG